MNYLKINYNDIANGEGLSVSVFVSGCPHHCPGCFNPESWDFSAGDELTEEIMDNIVEHMSDYGIMRNLSILGGEPLAESNLSGVYKLIQKARKKYGDFKIYLWTGYLYEDLLKQDNPLINKILNEIDILIDGPYIADLRDITLKLRGSSNQRIIQLRHF